MKRFWEVDFVRGLAVVLMIFYNWSYTLRFLDIYHIVDKSNSLYWQIFPIIITSTFLFIAGISLSISWNRFQKTGIPKWKKYGSRGIKILGYGLTITLATLFFYPENFIFYGILHLIGTTILLSPLVIDDWKKSLTATIIIISSSLLIQKPVSDSLTTAAIGITQPNFQTLDYFPLIPYSAIIFLGLTLGHLTYPQGMRRKQIQKIQKLQPKNQLIQKTGQHTLKIYLLHQPLLITLLTILGHTTL